MIREKRIAVAVLSPQFSMDGSSGCGPPSRTRLAQRTGVLISTSTPFFVVERASASDDHRPCPTASLRRAATLVWTAQLAAGRVGCVCCGAVASKVEENGSAGIPQRVTRRPSSTLALAKRRSQWLGSAVMSSEYNSLLKKFASSLPSMKRLSGWTDLQEATDLKKADETAEQFLFEFLDKEFNTHCIYELAAFPNWLTDEAIAYYCAKLEENIKNRRAKEKQKFRLFFLLGLFTIVVGIGTALIGAPYLIVGAATTLSGLVLSVGAPKAFPLSPSAKVGDQELFVLLNCQAVAKDFLRRINEQRANPR